MLLSLVCSFSRTRTLILSLFLAALSLLLFRMQLKKGVKKIFFSDLYLVSVEALCSNDLIKFTNLLLVIQVKKFPQSDDLWPTEVFFMFLISKAKLSSLSFRLSIHIFHSQGSYF